MIISSKIAASILIAGSMFSVLAIEALPISSHAELAVAATKPIAQKSQPRLRYTPPKLPLRRGLRSTQGAGSRSPSFTMMNVTLLAPSDHLGQTAAGHPNFYWHVSNGSPFPLQFALFERGVSQPIWVKRVTVKQAEIIKLAMPKVLPELKPGKEYRWSVSILRNPVDVSLNPVFHAFLTRGNLTPDQETQLKAATSDRDRAALYAEAGFWYDTVDAIATRYLDQPTEATRREDLLTLLDQVGLSKLLVQRR
ncbi:MAG: DUF928 domain-containing protein [Leptolyngbyaceae cyanobacterium CSU_1_3]|nr:DUF928 domain-containing protein [Leptolyngbyaceae cyanobacterium CSU_1_3]